MSIKSLGLSIGIAVMTAGTIPMAHAVVLGPGTGSQNTTQGTMPDGWNNVGAVSAASTVYLGNQWCITAAHVSAGLITPGTNVGFSTGVFKVDEPAIQLTTPGNGLADLQMFHISKDPGLSALTLSSASPTLSTPIYMVGNGPTSRDASPTFYTVTSTPTMQDPNHLTWTTPPTSAGANAGGFGYSTGRTKRWGTNNTSTLNGFTTHLEPNTGGMTNTFFADFYDSLTDYQNGGGTSSEAVLGPGDSGGGVFTSGNVLVGINLETFGFDNQPANTEVFGDVSGFADIFAYRSQIETIMATPEPGAASLLLLAVPFVLRRRRCL